MFDNEYELYVAASDLGKKLSRAFPQATSAWWTSYVVELAKWMAIQNIADLKGEAPHPDILGLVWDHTEWPFDRK